jgi:hypothetical protein
VPHPDVLVIARRFNGPPASANGGWAAGALARRIDAPAVAVSLKAPPPLDVPLALRPDADGVWSLLDGDTLLAQAQAATLALAVPAAPVLEEARRAGALARLHAAGRGAWPYARCFGCGILRHDGLAIVPGPCGDEGIVATDWTPAPAHAEPDGAIGVETTWAALDCPAGIAWSHRLPDAGPMVTVRITAAIDTPLRAGTTYRVIGWPIARDERKLHAGTAIVGPDDRVHARSQQLWLLPRARA